MYCHQAVDSCLGLFGLYVMFVTFCLFKGEKEKVRDGSCFKMKCLRSVGFIVFLSGKGIINDIIAPLLT